MIFREGLNGAKVIRAFGKEKQEFERYEQDNNEYTKTSIRVNAVVGLLMPIMSLIMSLATISITWIGGKAIDSGNMEIGTMMGCYQLLCADHDRIYAYYKCYIIHSSRYYFCKKESTKFWIYPSPSVTPRAQSRY